MREEDIVNLIFKSASEHYSDYFGQREADEHGDKVVSALQGRTISKSFSQADKPGGLKYEAEKLELSVNDLLRTLEGLCYQRRAYEVSPTQYYILTEQEYTSHIKGHTAKESIISYPAGVPKHSRQPISFKGNTIQATFNQLKRALGDPVYLYSPHEADKICAEWQGLTKEGKYWSLYDWKQYIDLEQNPGLPIYWNIGAANTLTSIEVKETIIDLLKTGRTSEIIT